MTRVFTKKKTMCGKTGNNRTHALFGRRKINNLEQLTRYDILSVFDLVCFSKRSSNLKNSYNWNAPANDIFSSKLLSIRRNLIDFVWPIIPCRLTENATRTPAITIHWFNPMLSIFYAQNSTKFLFFFHTSLNYARPMQYCMCLSALKLEWELCNISLERDKNPMQTLMR